MILQQMKNFVNYFNVFQRAFSLSSNKLGGNIIIKQIGPVTCLGINRPTNKNCLNPILMRELKDAVEGFEKDNKSAVAVIYGERGTFSYGYDPEEFSANSKLIEDVNDVGLLEKYSIKPVLAAVSGHALGPGFDLALWCDMRIVEDTALLGGYARRFGMPANDVIIQRMYSMLGLNKAMDLILTGRVITAKEAFECGIATRIVACGSGLGQAVSFAHSLANVPQACLKADRAALASLSRKYSAETLRQIQKERVEQRLAAIKEAETGRHITASGDVRKKYVAPSSNIAGKKQNAMDQ